MAELFRMLMGDNRELAPLARERQHYELHGLRLEVPPDACDALAERAIADGTSAGEFSKVVMADLQKKAPKKAVN